MSSKLAEIFRYCPSCGVPTSTPNRSPFRCNNCDFVHFFSPVCAVAGILADDAGQILLLVRARDPGKGKFGLPGGFVDPGEQLEAALAREMQEEVNLTATSMEYLCSYPNTYIYNDVAISVADVFFVCRVDSFDELQRAELEVAKLHFCDPIPTDLANMAFESNRLALQDYLQSRP